jgi:hypothetical protein
MKARERVVGPVPKFCCVISLLALFAINRSVAQDDYSLCEQTVTNENQLAGVFNCDTF